MAGLVAALGLVALVACSPAASKSDTGTLGPPESGTDRGLVVRVIDGDTVEIEQNGSVETVRYLGIDATKLGECFSAEATARNAELVLDVSVTLETDVFDRDQFGRLLRYVYLPNGRMVNEVLVEEGYAGAAESAPDTRYSAGLSAANERAKDAALAGGRPALTPSPGARPRAARSSAIRLTRRFACRPLRQISIAMASPTGSSSPFTLTRIGWTATATALPARADSPVAPVLTNTGAATCDTMRRTLANPL